ncbi:hypothetical protein GKQ23_23365 [Erwinia sp. E602]|uniref:hypothetical protein n=1 Tax=Erwinia sp. E602 TaxID=2675378 RepID=UPI001BA5AFDA|nr:hypothetical protein [Erwinia sp. E602]QUG77736.1 hypothetical protein GKQ23_23365 [Erwinia sp. E602]
MSVLAEIALLMRRYCVFLPLMTKKTALSHFFAINTCHPSGTPYNAPPSTRNNGLQASVLRGSGSSEPPEKTSQKEVDSEGGKRNIRHLATGSFGTDCTAL